MELQEERWFVRARGRTLGPLSARELASSVDRGLFFPMDKVCGSGDKEWTQLGDLPRFRVLFTPQTSREEILTLAPPSPLSLRKRKMPPLPLLPAVPEAPAAEEEVVVAAPAPLVTKEMVSAEPPTAEEIPEILEAIEEAVIVVPAAPSFFARLKPPLAAKVKKFEEPTPVPARGDQLGPSPDEVPALIELPKLEAWEELEQPIFLSQPSRQVDLESRWFGTPVMVKEEPAEAPEENVPDQPLPARPLFASLPRMGGAQILEAEAKPRDHAIRIELRLPKRNIFIMLMLVAGFAAAGIGGYWISQNKTRDLKDFRLPDPSSPTAVLSTEGDPIPPLKAPTRPQRD
jgi:hypothetical protein